MEPVRSVVGRIWRKKKRAARQLEQAKTEYTKAKALFDKKVEREVNDVKKEHRQTLAIFEAKIQRRITEETQSVRDKYEADRKRLKQDHKVRIGKLQDVYTEESDKVHKLDIVWDFVHALSEIDETTQVAHFIISPRTMEKWEIAIDSDTDSLSSLFSSRTDCLNDATLNRLLKHLDSVFRVSWVSTKVTYEVDRSLRWHPDAICGFKTRPIPLDHDWETLNVDGWGEWDFYEDRDNIDSEEMFREKDDTDSDSYEEWMNGPQWKYWVEKTYSFARISIRNK